MTADVARIVLGRAEMWSAELTDALARPRGPDQQRRVAALVAEADNAFGHLLQAIEIYAETLEATGNACRRDGVPVPAACRGARSLKNAARLLLSEVESVT
jgi:hypothetical protein